MLESFYKINVISTSYRDVLHDLYVNWGTKYFQAQIASMGLFNPLFFFPNVVARNWGGRIMNKKSHYANTPMQYTAIFHVCKNINFQIKNIIIFSFLIQTLRRF